MREGFQPWCFLFGSGPRASSLAKSRETIPTVITALCSLSPVVYNLYPGGHSQLAFAHLSPPNASAMAAKRSLPSTRTSPKRRKTTHTTPPSESPDPSPASVAGVQASGTDGVFALVSSASAAEIVALPAPTGRELIRLESYQLAQSISKNSASQTMKTFQPRWKAYTIWWDDFIRERNRKDPSVQIDPALPVTAEKAMHFLNYEKSRPQKHGRSADGTQQFREGTTLGKWSLIQAITALENLRASTAHQYEDNPEAQKPLRTDSRIKIFEKSVKRDEPGRIDKSQILKASGTSQDTYEPEELEALSLYCLKSPTTVYQLDLCIRDRAMVLLGCQSAFRGNNIRALLLSDLFYKKVPNVDAGLGKTVDVLSILADNAKHNQLGRVDEFGMIRHLKPELCAIGAVALHLFVQWHVRRVPLPSFKAEFGQAAAQDGYGPYGRREWYRRVVFAGKGGPNSEMTYETHRDRVKALHETLNITITKVTHAARPFTAQTAREYGASQSDTKAIGGWQDSGSYRAVYDRALPLPALIGAAMFSAKKPADYFVIRSALEPPASVVAQIFPWVDTELEAYHARVAENPKAIDIALVQLITLLRWLRVVLVQDVAILAHRAPQSLIFNYAPFNSAEFRAFADGADARLQEVEERVRTGMQHLPEDYQASMRALFLEEAARNAEARARNTEFQAAIIALLQPAHPVPGLQSVPQDMRNLFAASHSDLMRVPAVEAQTAAHAPSQPLPPHLAGFQPYASPLPALSTTLQPGNVAISPTGPRTSRAPPYALEQLPRSDSQASGSLVMTNPVPTTLFPLGDSPVSQTLLLPTGIPVAISHAVGGTAIAQPATVTTGRAQSSGSQPVLGPMPFTTAQHALPLPAAIRHVPAAALLNARALSPGLVPLMAGDILDPQWDKLVAAFGEANLLRYQWKRHNKVLIPEISLADSGTARETWAEWTVGVHGGFSIQQLDAWFGSAWKQNEGKLKTPYTKRKGVAELIDAIAKQRANWTPELALRFIEHDYAGYTAGTLYSKIITKPEKRKALLEKALRAAPP